jgi:hypothetical protein
MGGAYRGESGGWLERFRVWSDRDAVQSSFLDPSDPSHPSSPTASQSPDAAPDSPLDAATIFAYFDGRLCPEERSAVEAEAAASPAALRKLTRLAALCVRETASAADTPRAARRADAVPAVRVCLPPPQDVDTPEAALDRPELALRPHDEPDLELRRFRCQGADLVRVDHAAWPVGTLLKIDLEGRATTFAVLRPASQSGTAACVRVPAAFADRSVNAALQPVSAIDLTDADALPLGQAYHEARQADPRACSTVDAPISAWQKCAEQIIDADSAVAAIAPAILRFAETVLRNRP